MELGRGDAEAGSAAGPAIYIDIYIPCTYIVVTRKPGLLQTYVNGRCCAVVKLEAAKEAKAEAKAKEKKGDEGEGEGGEGDKGAMGPKPQLQEKFVLDPQFIALFATDDGASAKEQPVQGLYVKYLPTYIPLFPLTSPSRCRDCTSSTCASRPRRGRSRRSILHIHTHVHVRIQVPARHVQGVDAAGDCRRSAPDSSP